MTTFYISADMLASLASLASVAGTDHKFTPILATVKITATPETITAHATDRLTAARLTAPLGDTAHTLTADGASVLISTADLVMLAKAKIDGGMLAFEPGENGRAAHISEFSADNGTRYDLAANDGNYPPIERLFPESADHDIPTGVGISAAQIGKLAKLALPGESAKTRADAAFKSGYPAEHDGGTIYKPLVFERSDYRASLTVIVQPKRVAA